MSNFLHISFKLDDATVRLMKMPGSGVPDANGDSRMPRYAIGGKCAETHLAYFVRPIQDLVEVRWPHG